jgi:dsRNA-specific ribonuclease
VLEWCQKEKLSFNFKISEIEEKKGKVYVAELIVNDELKGKGSAFTKKKAEQIASEEFYKEIIAKV